MKYQTKLFIAFLLIAIASSALGLFITEVETKKYFFREFQSKVVSIAATAASQVDGDLAKQIKTTKDETLPAYLQLSKQLRRFRDVNRRSDVYVNYIYTVYTDPNDPKKFLFGVDVEEEKKNFSPPGSENPGATQDRLFDHLQDDYSHGEMVADPWGVWLTGYAPIHDSEGGYVGSLGVDVSADFVNHVMSRLWVHAVFGLISALFLSLILARFLAKKVSRELKAFVAATSEIGKGDFSYRVKVETQDEFGTLAKAINQMCEGLEEKERLKTGFARYVSHHVLEKIIKEKGSPKLEGERRKITVLFSDIRNFTRLSETMPPEEVVLLLNDYFKAMLEIIFKHNGMLDKLIGDGIMAEFGAPLDDPYQERNAILAAIEMQHVLKKLREKWAKEGRPVVQAGIGIHTGEAIIGTIGSEHRMEFTAIGDTVNIASRLQAATKGSDYLIIISESTFNALHGEFPSKDLGLLSLPGKKLPVSAYAILFNSGLNFK